MSDLSGSHFSQAEAQNFAQQLNARGFAPVKYGNDDDSVACRFYMRSVPDPQATASAGRPVHRLEEFVELRFPGGKTVYDQPATDEKRQRFHRHYDAFLRNKEKPEIVGTPLEVVPWLDAALVDDLRAFRVYSLEQLAALNDQQIATFGPLGLQLRTKAKAIIDSGTAQAPILSLQRQLDQAMAQINTLTTQLKSIGQEPVAAAPIAHRPRRGRPPKAAETTGEAA